MGEIDLSGKTVALFGLDNQDSYDDTFVDAIGAKVIGKFDGKFVGLALDEDNQEEFSDKRINLWIAQIKDQIL